MTHVRSLLSFHLHKLFPLLIASLHSDLPYPINSRFIQPSCCLTFFPFSLIRFTQIYITIWNKMLLLPFHWNIKAKETGVQYSYFLQKLTILCLSLGLVWWFKMLPLPFSSPDTVTIATQVFQSSGSVWSGTEVQFWKEWEGSPAWKVVSWWFLLPEGRKLLCDSHLVNLALQWATRTLRVGMFCATPKSTQRHNLYNIYYKIPSIYLLISWEQCFYLLCVYSQFNVTPCMAYSPVLRTVSTSSTLWGFVLVSHTKSGLL